jgi:hypothetical protein
LPGDILELQSRLLGILNGASQAILVHKFAYKLVHRDANLLLEIVCDTAPIQNNLGDNRIHELEIADPTKKGICISDVRAIDR